MASDLNKCCFIGWLARDPEVKNFQNGKSMTTFSIAVGESRIDEAGNKVKHTEWINIIAFGKLGDICGKYLTKGSHLYLEGKFKATKYTGKDGVEKNSYQIILQSMQMLGSPRKEKESHPVTTLAQDNDFDIDTIPF